MNKQTEILKQDIEKLFSKMVEERNPIKTEVVKINDGVKWIADCQYVNTIKTKDYRQYRKLFETLRNLIQMIYCKDRNFYNNIFDKIKEEMDIIHNLADESLDDNRFDQYRCLMDIYLSSQKIMPINNDNIQVKCSVNEITDEVLRRINEELNKTGKYATHIMDC